MYVYSSIVFNKIYLENPRYLNPVHLPLYLFIDNCSETWLIMKLHLIEDGHTRQRWQKIQHYQREDARLL